MRLVILEDIKSAIKRGRINVTDHADEELAKDDICDDELYFSTLHGMVIEEYKGDKPFPSCLIHGKDKRGRHIHSVWAYSKEHDIAVVITAYIPDPAKWINYKKRK